MKTWILQLSLVVSLVCPAAFSESTSCEPDCTWKQQLESWIESTSQAFKDTGVAAEQLFSGLTFKQVRGFAILMGVLGGTAYTGYLLNKKLPPWLSWPVVGILSGWGMYSFGAPILEQMSSDIRAKGFRQFAGRDVVLTEQERAALNELWARIQLELSINEQMARNVKAQALMSIRPHLIEALHQLNEGDEAFAQIQLAYCAVLIRRLFPELLASDPDLMLAIRSLFARHRAHLKMWKSQVLLIISQLSPLQIADREFYSEILDFWLGIK